jgi:hypothetical protein
LKTEGNDSARGGGFDSRLSRHYLTRFNMPATSINIINPHPPLKMMGMIGPFIMHPKEAYKPRAGLSELKVN